MIHLLIILVSVLLGMILGISSYLLLFDKYSRFITEQYKQIKKKTNGKEVETALKKDEKPSFVGASKYKVGHGQTKAATDLETEKGIEKASIFAASADENPEMTAVNVPLEKIEKMPEKEFDDDAEAVELELEKGAVLASGAQFDELQKVGHAIVNKEASSEEKETAGRVLYENKKTDMFEQLASSNTEWDDRITMLINLHLARRRQELGEEPEEVSHPESFQDFDINSIF